MSKTTVKLFVSYKEKHRLLQNEIITPIQTGRAIAKKSFAGMLGDDSGDNISDKNNRYCELSAQYWVWKHYQEIGNPDYVGFMHYRRHFIFDKNFRFQDRQPWLPGMPIYKVPVWNDECDKNLQPATILKTLQTQADCYVMKAADMKKFEPGDSYMKHHFLNYVPGSKREVWNQFVQVIQDVYPEYVSYLKQFMYGSVFYACNMFIMKKAVFFEYSEFCFKILQELDKRVDSSAFTGQEERFLGFLGEYLLTIFVMKLEAEHKKIEYLNALFLEYPEGLLHSGHGKKPSHYFAITNTDTHKVLVLFGHTVKLMPRSKEKILQQQLDWQARRMQVLESKITDLEEELFATKQR